MKPQIEFRFGKKMKTIWDWVIMTVSLELSLEAISLLPGVNRKDAFDLIDDVVDSQDLDEYITKDTELLDYRVENTIDEALEDYND